MEISKSDVRKIKKYAKKISPLTIFLAILFLVVGALSAWFAMGQICKNDTVEVLGEKHIVKYVDGTTSTELYVDEGFKAIVFGQDVSSSVVIETNIVEKGTNPNEYILDLSKEGEYYIKYTLNNFKFGTVVKYRSFVVVNQEVAS